MTSEWRGFYNGLSGRGWTKGNVAYEQVSKMIKSIIKF